MVRARSIVHTDGVRLSWLGIGIGAVIVLMQSRIFLQIGAILMKFIIYMQEGTAGKIR